MFCPSKYCEMEKHGEERREKARVRADEIFDANFADLYADSLPREAAAARRNFRSGYVMACQDEEFHGIGLETSI